MPDLRFSLFVELRSLCCREACAGGCAALGPGLTWTGKLRVWEGKPVPSVVHRLSNQQQIPSSVLLGNPYCEEFILLNIVSHRNCWFAVTRQVGKACSWFCITFSNALF